MKRTFAGFEYVEKDVPVNALTESPTQPCSRNEMDSEKRVKLSKDIEQNGLKDRIDIIQRPDGKLEIVEGHGRAMAVALLGWDTIPAKVYRVETEADVVALRTSLFNANSTISIMSKPQWVEYLYRNRLNGVQVTGASKDIVAVVDFLTKNFTKAEVGSYIFEQRVGPAQLSSARAAARDLLGLPDKGGFPQTDDATRTLVNCFRWVVKHAMSRAVIEWRADGRGVARLRRFIDSDQPLPKTRGNDSEE